LRSAWSAIFGTMATRQWCRGRTIAHRSRQSRQQPAPRASNQVR